MATNSERRDSNTELLRELEALSQSLFQSNNTRHNASLILDRSSVVNDSACSDRGSQSHRLSSSPWKSKAQKPGFLVIESTAPREKKKKKGIWSWKPLRALSHIRMQQIGCLFSVKVISIQGLPASTNGLRLCVAVRKEETKDGAVRTMPSRVTQGSAEFEETLFVQCHLYCNGKPPVFEPRLFLISVVAVDAPELDLGMSMVDLSFLVEESIERSFEGARVREWDVKFELSGKAKGGELVLRLGVQIMEGGVSIYSQAKGLMKKNKGKGLYSSTASNESMSSFSSTSNLSVQKVEDQESPKIDIVDMGIEKVAERREDDEGKSEKAVDNYLSVSGEVAKEVVRLRIAELESIAKEIKALESTMIRDGSDLISMTGRNIVQQLDPNEETMTRKFLQMLEVGDDEELDKPNLKTPLKIEAMSEGEDNETTVFMSDLEKGLGPVVQTKDGGYLVSMNPFNMKIERDETPKLAMQISRAFILEGQKREGGLEVFQKLAAMGPEELTTKLVSLMDMDELMGKTAGQIAFEGVASAIISGRNKEGASFSAARSITNVKMMAKAMVEGRKERTSAGVWNAKENPMTMEETLTFSMQKIEVMAVEGLKIQAEMAEEEAPFDVPNLIGKEDSNYILDSAISLEEWEGTCATNDSIINILVTIQLRDPIRRYEPVGGLQIAVLQAVRMETSREDDEERFKLTGIHVGGLKLKSVEGQRQGLNALQWLVGIGMGKTGWKKKVAEAKIGKNMIWSFSSRLMANAWLKPARNPNLMFL